MYIKHGPFNTSHYRQGRCEEGGSGGDDQPGPSKVAIKKEKAESTTSRRAILESE